MFGLHIAQPIKMLHNIRIAFVILYYFYVVSGAFGVGIRSTPSITIQLVEIFDPIMFIVQNE